MRRVNRAAGSDGSAGLRALLCLSTYPAADASVRQRFLAYEPYLRDAGWDVRFDTIVSPTLYAMKNRHGARVTILKGLLLAAGLARRAWVIARCARYEAIWIHREAFPFFTPLAETVVRRIARGRVVLDFDDALYAPPPSGRDWRTAFRRPSGFAGAIRCASVVLAGSPVLGEWARSRGVDAEVVPTCVDTRAIRPMPRTAGGDVTIGWIGSWSTAPYVGAIAGALRKAAAVPGVRIVAVGAANLAALQREVPAIEYRPWDQAREAADLAAFDIGIMPVPDTEWNRGKCAFKVIQYMAAGIPFVASPVGMNRDVAEESGGGLLAGTEDEWVAALERLVADRALRGRLAAAGRRHVVEHYDVAGHAWQVLRALDPGDGM